MTDNPTTEQLAKGEALATRQELMFYFRMNKNQYIELLKAGLPCKSTTLPRDDGKPKKNASLKFHIPTVSKWLDEECPDRYSYIRLKARWVVGTPVGRRR